MDNDMADAYNDPSAGQQPYAYLTYLNFGENVATLLLQLAALPLDINLLITSTFYPKKLTVSSHASGVEHGGLSKSMVALISTHVISIILMVPYAVYVAVAWRVPEKQPREVALFNPYLLFWLGMACNLIIVVPQTAVFFLTLDRLLTLMWGHAYGKREKTLFLYVEIVVLTAVTLGVTGLTIIIEWPLQLDASKHTTASILAITATNACLSSLVPCIHHNSVSIVSLKAHCPQFQSPSAKHSPALCPDNVTYSSST